MPGRRRLALLGLAAVTGLGAVAVPAAALAAPVRTAASVETAVPAGAVAKAKPKPQWYRSNTGAAHSPALLRQLAGPSGTKGPVISNRAMAVTAGPVSGAPQGVDVASYQHPSGAAINWTSVAGAGIRFAAVKTTEGAYYTNSWALKDLPQAAAAGLTPVAYAFAIPNGGSSGKIHYSASPVVQADDLVSYLTSNHVTVAATMLDIEYDPYAGTDGTPKGSWCYGLSQAAMVSWISGFVNEIKARTGQYPIIYTPSTSTSKSPSWWSKCTGNSTKFGQTPVWIPDYSSTASSPQLPNGWSGWNIWQYGQGTVKGISGSATDLDQLNPKLVTVLDPGPQQDPAGTAIPTVQITPFSVTPPPAFSYAAAGLPPGLNLDPGTGAITGTPTVPGSYSVTVTVTDTSSGATGKIAFGWQVPGVVSITPVAGQSTVAGSPVSLQVQASDTAAGQTPVFTAAGLPAGLSISSKGLITGWPDSPGSSPVTVTASDSLGGSATASFGWTVTPAPDQGPTGAVKLDLGGKCLNDVGNAATNGTATDIWTCDGSTSQRWTRVQDDTLRIHGLCLDVYHSGKANGTKVDIYNCNGSGAQQWRLGTGGALVNPNSGKCLTDPGGSTKNGTRLEIYACGGKKYQLWTLPTGPLVSQVPGLCLDDSRNRTANGNPIDVYSCNGSAAQGWVVQPNGTVQIHGRCLDVSGGRTASGTPLDLHSCNGTAAQQWHISAPGDGVILVNPHSGKCLADPGSATTAGTRTVISTCSGIPGEGWRFA